MIKYIRINSSEVNLMKHVYVEFADGTLVTFNDIRRDNNGEHIDVYFERPQTMVLLFYRFLCQIWIQLLRKDLQRKDFATDNEALIWEMAR